MQRFQSVWNIMEQSFPKEERRSFEGQKELVKHPAYRIECWEENGKIISFVAFWEFEDFIYIEHIASLPECRGKGIGAKLINNILSQKTNKKVVLEVEPPKGEIETRRINFYQKLGFILNEYPYFQPSLNEDTDGVELMVMSHELGLDKEQFENIKDVLYKEVYNLK